MNPPRSLPKLSPQAQEQRLLEAALALETEAERHAFLASVGDAALRQRLEELLASSAEADSFFREPPHQHAGVIDPGLEPTIQKDARTQETPAQMLGRYKLLEMIGEGGFGEVWMADQREPVKRRVALKIIKLGMDSRQTIARFEAERQALAMMDHANIAKIFDAGVTDAGRPYFVMELVRGTKITDYCDDNKLTTRQRLDLFIKVCQAIQHAHQKGVIHRDIKPSNILVTLHDGVPVPKVIDFGIAKATQGELTDKTVFTQFQQFIGTPAYISPEQAEMSGLDIDTRADIYSLGVLLYELLVGQTPFDAKEMMKGGLDALRRIIREKEPLRPSTKLNTLQGDARTTAGKRRQTDVGRLVHQLQGDLDWIVMKCLEKDRTRRYDTANGLASDIQRHLNNEAVLACPPSAAYRFQKMVKRNKLAFAAASAVTLTLIAGLSFSTWAFLSEAAQRRSAVEQKTKAEAAQASETEQRSKADAEKITAERHLYVANLYLAQQAWEQNNLGRLRQLLEVTQESPNRGFEWYYWQRQTHLPLRTLRGHLEDVTSVAFSPDGQRIVTGSWDRTAKLWDAASGRELFSLKGHSAPIWCAAFSADGQKIVTGSWDQTAKVWVAANGTNLITLKGHSAPIRSVAFSPDNQRIVTGSWDQTARVWEAATGQPLLTLSGTNGNVGSVAFSPDGQRIVTCLGDSTAKVWDAVSGRELLTLKHEHQVRSVAFSPDGRRIVTGSEDKSAKVWEAANGRQLLTLKGHTAGIGAVAFSQDGQRIVTGGDDQMAKVWETASGRQLLTLKGHTAGIGAVAFSRDGQRIVTGGDDRTARAWETVSGRELLTLNGHSGGISSVAFSTNGQRIVTGSDDQTAKVWDAASGKVQLTLKGHNARITSVAFSPDGQQIVTGSWDQTAKVWATASGRELLTLNGHSGGISSVVFSPDGQRIVTGSDDNTAKVWEAISGRELLPLTGHNGGISSVAFSPDGQRIMTGSRDQMAKVWEAASAEQVATWQKEDKAAAERLAVLGRERAETAERERLHGAQDAGAIRHVTFMKWGTSLPANPPSLAGVSLGGVVGGDVGSGRLAGEILSDRLFVTGFWLGHTRYEFYGDKHSFIADIHVTENTMTDPVTAVITGVVTQGWRKGAQLTGEYTEMPVCPIPTPGNVSGTRCYQVTLQIDGGSEQ